MRRLVLFTLVLLCLPFLIKASELPPESLSVNTDHIPPGGYAPIGTDGGWYGVGEENQPWIPETTLVFKRTAYTSYADTAYSDTQLVIRGYVQAIFVHYGEIRSRWVIGTEFISPSGEWKYIFDDYHIGERITTFWTRDSTHFFTDTKIIRRLMGGE